jgi:hypothetical protein
LLRTDLQTQQWQLVRQCWHADTQQQDAHLMVVLCSQTLTSISVCLFDHQWLHLAALVLLALMLTPLL